MTPQVLTGFVSWGEGASAFEGRPGCFSIKNTALWSKGLLQMHSQQNPLGSLFLHQGAHEAKEVFLAEPSYAYFSGKK